VGCVSTANEQCVGCGFGDVSDSLSGGVRQGELPRGPQSLSAVCRRVNWWNGIFLENISKWQLSRIP
jgi:hypothetical protein